MPNKRELQETASNHLADIEFNDFTKLYKGYSKVPFLSTFFSELYNFTIR